MAFKPNAPKNVRIAGIEWNEHYNTYRALVAGWLELGFVWTSGEGYVISVAGVKIKARGTDPQASAEIAVRAARKLMEKAQRNWHKLPPGPKPITQYKPAPTGIRWACGRERSQRR